MYGTQSKEALMNYRRAWWVVLGVFVSNAWFFASLASAQAPAVEGSYQLVERKLPDGTIIKPPEIIGLWTYTKTHRNFNIMRKDATGKFTSRSLVSTYALSGTEYTETVLLHIRTDQIGGKDVVYDVGGKARNAPAAVEGTRLQFKLPHEALAPVTVEGNRITVIAPSGGVDVWEKVP
jgi:hypothetical protein